MRNALTIAAFGLLAAGVMAAPAPIEAQNGDTGTFRITVEGRDVGTDTFNIRRSGAGTGAVTTAQGRVQLQLTQATVDRVTELQVSGVRAALSRYAAGPPAGSPGTRIFSSVSSGIFTTEMRTPTGEAMRQFQVSEGAVVLDEWVAHHYTFLAQRPRNGPVPIVIPSQNRQVMGTLDSRGETSVQIGGRSVPAYHLVLRMDDDAADVRHIWVDSLNRVLRVRIPAQGYEAVRTAAPE